MQELLKPIKSESLKEIFIFRFENLILSGKLSIGQKLPSERELALQLGVSRPVVHEGLVDLASKGLITLTPRIGTVVNDYRTEGSLTMLSSLFNYHDGQLDPGILKSVLDMRMLFERETAKLAATHRTDDHLTRFEEILKIEEELDAHDTTAITETDFTFHHLIAMASGNMIYPLLLNSFKQFYMNMAGQFFADASLVSAVFKFHIDLVQAIKDKNNDGAIKIMEQTLKHGEEHLKRLIENN
ncbi:MAG: FadR family transcriptional regulator [Desulfobacterales bacterium]|nr:FadR family transcriptional regulator [Desulfobacterales bacterium]